MADVSYRFDPEEWEKKPRKPFNIKKTWTRAKLPEQQSEQQPEQQPKYESNDDGDPPVYDASLPRSRSASPPPSLSDTDEQSRHEVLPSASTATVGSEKSTSTALKRITEHMPSLRNSPVSARRSDSLREIWSANLPSSSSQKVAAGQPRRPAVSSSRKQPPVTARSAGSTKTLVSGKGKQPLSSSTQSSVQHANKRKEIYQDKKSSHDEPVIGKMVPGNKRNQPSSSSAIQRAKKRQQVCQDEDSSQSGEESGSASGKEVELWMCSKRLKRTKNDLCEIDLVMSSLRDTAQELYQEVDSDLEQQTLHQVVKKSMESLWKLIKESAAYKDVQLELKRVNGQLQKSRAGLLAKGKERNQKLMRLCKLQQRARYLAMCEKAKTTNQETVEQFNALKQNLATTPML